MNLSQLNESLKNLFSKLAVKRNIFLLIGLAIILELVWAYRYLNKPQPPQVSPGNRIIVSPKVTTISQNIISLATDKSTLKVGDKVVVSVEIKADKATDGTDLVILYDPKLLSVLANSSKQVMNIGSLYNDYPVNMADEKAGRISVSGISTQSGGVVPNGTFGTLTFRAEAPGNATVSLGFTPGSTTDTNMIETRTAKDILAKVDNLDIRIFP